jgi:hypothetical protein
MSDTLNIGDLVEYVYSDGKKDLVIGIVVNVETHDDYENEYEYSVLWLDEDEAHTVFNGYSSFNGYTREQLVKVSQ